MLSNETFIQLFFLLAPLRKKFAEGVKLFCTRLNAFQYFSIPKHGKTTNMYPLSPYSLIGFEKQPFVCLSSNAYASNYLVLDIMVE